ncbi:MAG: hypothetical protein [Bacteriophage sp.]|nr:MAG: hypothetical protein [Bacteriophage sp.]
MDYFFLLEHIKMNNNQIIIDNRKQKITRLYNINVSSALYSSLLALVRNYIKSIFPSSFFKSEYIANSVYTVTNSASNDDKSMVNERPNLAMQMNLIPEDDASFTMDSFVFANLNMPKSAWTQPVLFKRIAWDRVDGIFITAPSVRSKHTFDFTITLNSEIQAINVFGFLKSKLGINRPFFLNKRIIEVPIPMSLIATIAAAKKMNLKDSKNIEPFNKLLTEISNGIITYKYHHSSGKYLYFYKYMANLLFKVTDLSNIDKEMVEKSIVKTSVKFSVSVEYDTHTSFIAESFQNLPDPLESSEFLVDDFGVGAVFHNTLVNLPSIQLDNGMKVIFSNDIITDIGQSIDITPFGGYLSPEILNYISHLKTKDATLDLLKERFSSLVFRDGIELKKDIDYTINWRKLQLELNEPLSNYDYKFVLYTDLTEFNDFITSLDTSRNI